MLPLQTSRQLDHGCCKSAPEQLCPTSTRGSADGDNSHNNFTPRKESPQEMLPLKTAAGKLFKHNLKNRLWPQMRGVCDAPVHSPSPSPPHFQPRKTLNDRPGPKSVGTGWWLWTHVSLRPSCGGVSVEGLRQVAQFHSRQDSG